MILTQTEKNLISKIKLGEIFEGPKILESTQPFIVRAKVIRGLLLHQFDIKNEQVVTRAGIYMRNIVIEGDLILDGMDGQEKLPSLTFSACHFYGCFSAKNCSVVALNFKHSRFISPSTPLLSSCAICIDNIHHCGTLNLQNVGPLDKDGMCWVSARDARIEGSILLTNSHFACPFRESLNAKQLPRYALNFLNAHILGNFESKIGLIADGGIKLVSAKVEGDITLSGSTIISGEGLALAARALNCDSNIIITPVKATKNQSFVESKLIGPANFYGAEIKGAMQISGTKIELPTVNITENKHEDALVLSQCKLKKGLFIGVFKSGEDKYSRFKCRSSVSMVAAKIEGGINLNGASIGVRENQNYSLNASDIEVKGTFLLNTFKNNSYTAKFETDSGIFLSNAKLNGNLEAQSCVIGKKKHSYLVLNRIECTKNIQINDAEIKESFHLDDSRCSGTITIYLKRPSINGFSEPYFCTFEINRAIFSKNLAIAADCKNLSINHTEIKSSLQIVGVVTRNIEMYNLIVGRDFYMSDLSFQEPPKIVNPDIVDSSLEADCNDQIEQEQNVKSESNKVIAAEIEDKVLNHLIARNAKVGGNLVVNLPSSQPVDDIFPVAAFKKELICYSGYTYYEVEISRKTGTWYSSFLHPTSIDISGSETLLCNGNSTVFHQLNEQGCLDISNEKLAIEYLKLFCANVWGGEGAFAIVENSDNLAISYVDRCAPGFSFESIRPPAVLPLETPILTTDGDNRTPEPHDKYLIEAHIRYGYGLFKGYFLILENGSISMPRDDILVFFKEETMPEFKPPLRQSNRYFSRKSYFVNDRDTEMEPVKTSVFEASKHVFQGLLVRGLKPNNLRSAFVDLRDMSVSGLDDDDGLAWGKEVTLKLKNFTYDSYVQRDTEVSKKKSIIERLQFYCLTSFSWLIYQSVLLLSRMHFTQVASKLLASQYACAPPKEKEKVTKNRIAQRLEWLALQGVKYEEKSVVVKLTKALNKLPFVRLNPIPRKYDLNAFEPQPHVRAAGVFRKEGVHELARKIDFETRKKSGLKYAKSAGLQKPIIYLLHFLYGISSKFGLSPILSFIWLVFFILLGGFTTDVVQNKGMLIVSASPVTNVISPDEKLNKQLIPSYIRHENASPVDSIKCSDSLEPLLYAADIFLPLIDLDQESKCSIGPRDINDNTKLSQWAENESNLIFGLYAKLLKYGTNSFSDSPGFWQWWRSLYSILGWIMLSLFVFSLTNRLRTNDPE